MLLESFFSSSNCLADVEKNGLKFFSFLHILEKVFSVTLFICFVPRVASNIILFVCLLLSTG